MSETKIASFRTVTFTSEIERANDTTEYADGDVILSATGTMFVLGVAITPGQSVDNGINSVLREESETWSAELNAVTVTFGNATPFALRIWFFTALPSGLTDNSAIDLTDEFIKNYLITVIAIRDDEAFAGSTNSAVYHKRNIDCPFTFKQNDANVDGRVYAFIEATGAFTPTAEDIISMRAVFTQD